MIPADLLVTSMIGDRLGLSYDEAKAEVQALLDRLPALAETAGIWRGGARDDTVYFGNFVWTVFEYDGDPRPAAMVWLEDYAAIIRRAGLNVSVAKL